MEYFIAIALIIGWAALGIYSKVNKKNSQRLYQNFPFIHKGITYWYSRSCAINAFIFGKDENGEIYILANKRGKGTPDFQGYWNAPCGYLDFGEDGKEATMREVREECGVKVPYNKLSLVDVASNPKENKQNVILSYISLLDGFIHDYKFSTKEMEKDEVDEIAWVNINDVDKYQWAFNHKARIKRMAYYIISNKIPNDSSSMEDDLYGAEKYSE